MQEKKERVVVSIDLFLIFFMPFSYNGVNLQPAKDFTLSPPLLTEKIKVWEALGKHRSSLTQNVSILRKESV